jgi:hypothetical protein
MQEPTNYQAFLYWIRERELIREKKERGDPKPWSKDEVFQDTYFCNVKREDDKVTKWIRQHYSPYVDNEWFEFNIILSRFLNWPPTLERIGFVDDGNIRGLGARIRDTEEKIWGNAYVVTTHGIQMDKVDYLIQRVLPSAILNVPIGYFTCTEAARHLQNIEGISTFMAGQVVADLKNTDGHPLATANDWWDFALPGPGSRRGMDWLYAEEVSERDWYPRLLITKSLLYNDGIVLHAQDVQNCLCEFDKYCRVSMGTGRSKRRYHGR